MIELREVKMVLAAKPVIEGAGVHLKRVFGSAQVPHFDPFLMLDDFHSDNPAHYLKGFPWHPHRGIETITYVLQGIVEHGDSMGNSGGISSGDVQWMTAGSGIIHQEMPKGDEMKRMWGFQLWANLPASQKMMDPRYREVKSEEIPEILMETGIKVKIIAGEVNGVRGPVRDIVIDPTYADVAVPASSTFTHAVQKGHTVFIYVIEGQGNFNGGTGTSGLEYRNVGAEQTSVGSEHLVLYGDGEAVRVTTGELPVRFLLVSGKPIGEPVAWRGPIVMNTQDELEIAFDEYQKGTFVKHKPAG
ncbi:MAG: quercetin 2,3-dioxygenase [Thermodesulfobacteriota bacterium]|nr:quercetin 2,3-dioxygenase [Thermodesulfobacteriota bacterium]